MDMRAFTLDDKYDLGSGRIYLTGSQALARLCLLQKQRDLAAGLNTAGYISGYRGSPLGGLDQVLWSIGDRLQEQEIIFRPGVNEDLAATAIWGTQQLNLFPGARYDGVFALWYGKGPGVDRSGDALKHANSAGTAKHGGVLLCAGDDHICKSSTLPHQSEYALMDAGIPVLNPASVEEILEYGLYGWAMSRYSGCWVALKLTSEIMDSSASLQADSERLQIIAPAHFKLPADGLNIRLPDTPLEQEARLHHHKLYAAIAFAQANQLDKIVIDPPQARLGIITTGKSYLDVRQALQDLGIDRQLASDLGIRLYKVAMPWPLDSAGARAFATGLEEILVVEEKRALIENQLKEQLYNTPRENQPRIFGKHDEHGNWLLPSNGELSPAQIARAIAGRIANFVTSEKIEQRLKFLEQKEKALQSGALNTVRKPHFCAGCPHNRSTRVPQGSRAAAGIGCHYMVNWMNRETYTFTQMGGEGASWNGLAPFCDTGHIFVNIGDGTYFHSGSLAIRAALAADVNVTYKILFNNAVAMTGGQPVDGELSVPQLARQLAAEGVKRIAIVSDDPQRYRHRSTLPQDATVSPRGELDRIQRELREVKGVSALIFDQMCATEKRRQIKRGRLASTSTFAYINPELCEDCGDCSRASNCLAIVPRHTELGTKRRIDQAACTQDESCLDGFCPSFVSVEGRRKSADKKLQTADISHLKEPELPSLERPWSILLAGVGGTGVVTLSAILGVAAHIDQKEVRVLDMTGLAQKFGAVSSHVRIARDQELYAARISAGQADLLLGCDAISACSQDALAKLDPQRAHAVINNHATITSEYLSDPDKPFPGCEIEALISAAVQPGQAWFLDSIELAQQACGNPIASNMLLLGYAWQKGLVPLSLQSLQRAIELNRTAVEMNQQAFNWGRCLAADQDSLTARLLPAPAARESLAELIQRRARLLTEYHDQSLADRYRVRIEKLQKRAALVSGDDELVRVAAEQYARLLMIKDEYEVARQLCSTSFRAELDQQFEPGYKISYWLAPPVLSHAHADEHHPGKIHFGPWLRPLLKLLATSKRVRNSALDPFRYSRERKNELALVAAYEKLIDQATLSLSEENLADSLARLQSAELVRGYGHIRQQAALEVMAKWAQAPG